MNCRGHEKRVQICNVYDVEPIAHLKLLNGQTKRSDAEAVIKYKYYIFECTHKVTGDIENIQCGNGAGKDILELIGHKGLTCFNPMLPTQKKRRTSLNKDNISLNQGNIVRPWHPAAEQLYNGIMLMIMEWDAHDPTKPLYKLKREAEKYKYCEPYYNRVARLNSIIAKDKKQRTLLKIIEDMSAANEIREYQFNLLQEILLKNNPEIKSYFM